MSATSRFGAVLFVLVVTPLAAWPQPIPSSGTACSGGDLRCLAQGWNEKQRSWWYTTTQGSRLLPLSWALALKTVDGAAPFFGPNNLRSLGYLDNPHSQDNPFGLPVGFVIDDNNNRSADLMCDRFSEMCFSRTMREPWVGLNCSACHTAEIQIDATTIRVDGAPANARFDDFVNGVQDALAATRNDDTRLDAFIRQVRTGTIDAEAKASVIGQIDEQLVWMQTLRDINGDEIEAGPARLDAQGHILTKVSLINGAGDQTSKITSDAPASYPFIWNTHQQPKLQWNGIAGKIAAPALFGRETDLGALVRNVSEVIGVFAHIEADRGWAALGYSSSVRVSEMVGLERQLALLNSPAWPRDLAPIDDALALTGQELFYSKGCNSCHEPLARGDLNSAIEIKMEPVQTAGTDVFLACNTFLRTALAGNMKRQKKMGYIGERIEGVDKAHKMLVNAAVGATLGKVDELLRALFTDIAPDTGLGERIVTSLGPEIEYLPGVVDQVKKDRARECLTTEDELLAYKARPLNGIWATAPYLHNGSVPTLYDLLLPAKARNTRIVGEDEPAIEGPLRPDSFHVGSRVLDTKKVGFADAEGTWLYRVYDDNGNLIPGNSNAGHDYGNAALTDDERWAIVEYLKTL